MIRYLAHNQVDKTKWDACIERSPLGMVYAFSWYLDRVSEGWEALVEGDYESVFPLTAKKKLGINYLYQPVYTQQLGIFSLKGDVPCMINNFIDGIPEKFKLVDIKLNTANIYTSDGFKIIVNNNFELDLSRGYPEICVAYSENVRRNIKKSLPCKLVVTKDITLARLLEFKKENEAVSIGKKQYSILGSIIEYALQHNLGEIIGILSEGRLIAAMFILYSKNKRIYLLSASSPEGKSKRAMFFAIDFFIKENAGKNIVLDFEGSNLPGLARFYSGFGAILKNYQRVRRNSLPLVIRLFI